MGADDPTDNRKGGLFSEPSGLSLDDLMGPTAAPDAAAAALDAPDPATLAQFVPFKVDVSETGEPETGEPETDRDGASGPEDEPSALVQFVPESGSAQVSEFSSDPARSQDISDSNLPRSVSLESAVAAPTPRLMEQLSFPKPEPTDAGLSTGERVPLTPLVKPAPEAEPPPAAAGAPAPPPPDEPLPQPPDPLPSPEPPVLEEAAWGDEPDAPPAPLLAHVEAVQTSDPLMASDPPATSRRQMVAPPPSPEPLHPAIYLLLAVLGLLAILAFAVPMLR